MAQKRTFIIDHVLKWLFLRSDSEDNDVCSGSDPENDNFVMDLDEEDQTMLSHMCIQDLAGSCKYFA